MRLFKLWPAYNDLRFLKLGLLSLHNQKGWNSNRSGRTGPSPFAWMWLSLPTGICALWIRWAERTAPWVTLLLRTSWPWSGSNLAKWEQAVPLFLNLGKAWSLTKVRCALPLPPYHLQWSPNRWSHEHGELGESLYTEGRTERLTLSIAKLTTAVFVSKMSSSF